MLRIGHPKNARQMGVQQYVEIRHYDSMNWVAWLKLQTKADAALWSSSPTKFRNMFKSVCRSLKISHLHLSPASLRAGGATWFIDEGHEVGRVRFLGRWAHLRSLEHYIQVARAQQISLSIPPATSLSLKQFLQAHMFLLVLPVFFRAQVLAGHLMPSRACSPETVGHVVAAARVWGRMDQSLEESYSSSRASQRGPIR